MQVKFISPNVKSTQEGISEKTMRSSKSTAPIAIHKSNRCFGLKLQAKEGLNNLIF